MHGASRKQDPAADKRGREAFRVGHALAVLRCPMPFVFRQVSGLLPGPVKRRLTTPPPGAPRPGGRVAATLRPSRQRFKPGRNVLFTARL